MSWLVDVEFRSSKVDGMGVFARRAIRSGTRLWQFDESMHVCDSNALAGLDDRDLAYALHGGYLHGPSDKFLWYRDGMQFMNHADGEMANVGLGFWPELRQDHCVALRDIAAGEELFEDYSFWADAGLDPRHWLHPFYMRQGRRHYHFLRGLERQPVAA
ncbi:SET domain-containing protein-lysine N-methyltransferase [Amaricoccus solimangrovi]|uniref:SET domain-containing protein n=1 Tax=Amaricoccus solimangrovi TaxID=2589815 RepID=A0A501WTG9_9RHOB|nr:SET domain-containing protein [Amaricoccus solimangrovi]TPE51404.1 SET domain-containing protein [Amaricoccus solimangrovi]